MWVDMYAINVFESAMSLFIELLRYLSRKLQPHSSLSA